jgi:hypothetical protein
VVGGVTSGVAVIDGVIGAVGCAVRITVAVGARTVAVRTGGGVGAAGDGVGSCVGDGDCSGATVGGGASTQNATESSRSSPWNSAA